MAFEATRAQRPVLVPTPASSQMQPDRARLSRDVLGLAVPAIGEQLLFTVVQMAALMIVGHLGANAIASVGVSNQLHWLFQSSFWAFSAGTTTLVARFTGSNEPLHAESAVRQAVMVSLGVCVVVSSVGFAFAPGILSLMGTEGEVLTHALVYLRMAFVASVFQSMGMCFAAALRGAGDTRTPFKVGGLGALINVSLIWLLVSGRLGLPSLGIAGVGVGLIVSQLVVASTYLLILSGSKFKVKFSLMSRFTLDPSMIRRLLSVGIPAAIEQLLMSFGMTVFTRLVISLGTVHYASHQVCVNITSVSFMTGFGFSMAATALVGQSLGRKDPDLAQKYALTTSKIGVGIMTLLGAIFFLFGGNLVSLYSADPEIISMGAMILKYAAFAQPAMAFYSIMSGALRGAGDTRYPLYITFAGMWTLRIGSAHLLVQILGMGLAGVWIAVNADQWVRTALVYLRFRTGRWKDIKV